MQPSGDLLDSRPEQIVAQYLADYIAVAGTFPCAADLASYPFRDIHVGDQFLLGHGCRVQRPVASATVLSVWVHHKGAGVDSWVPQATVRYRVTYRDEERWENTLTLQAMESDSYFLAYIHLTCWGSLDTELLYPDIVAEVPSGAEYYTGIAFVCKR